MQEKVLAAFVKEKSRLERDYKLIKGRIHYRNISFIIPHVRFTADDGRVTDIVCE